MVHLSLIEGPSYKIWVTTKEKAPMRSLYRKLIDDSAYEPSRVRRIASKQTAISPAGRIPKARTNIAFKLNSPRAKPDPEISAACSSFGSSKYITLTTRK
jgi:hypothetical protein